MTAPARICFLHSGNPCLSLAEIAVVHADGLVLALVLVVVVLESKLYSGEIVQHFRPSPAALSFELPEHETCTHPFVAE
jgi:hypothetical protein